MTYELINQLTESRLVPTKHRLNKFNLRDIGDFTFLYFLALQLMYDEPSTHVFAKEYARRTYMFSNFNNFIYSSTDLYIFLHVLTGKNADVARRLLKDQKENALMSKTMSPNINLFKHYLVFMRYGRLNSALVRRNLLTMQKELGITRQNYRSMRILIAQWDKISIIDKRLVMTRLLQAMRLRARLSDILPELEKLAKTKQLELKGVNNAEKNEKKADVKKPSAAPWWVKTAAGAAGAYAGYKLTRRKK